MTQYYTDFSEYTAGVAPSDWTMRWASGLTAEIVEKAEATGGKVLALADTTSANARKAFTWDAIDEDSGRDEVEIFARFMVLSDAVRRDFRLLGRGSGAESAENGVHAGIVPAGSGVARVAQYLSGVSTTLNENAFPIDGVTVYLMRAQVSGTTGRVRIWPDGDTEPSAWLSTSDALTVSGLGWVGIFLFNQRSNVHVEVFSVGTNGDPAPTEPLATGPTITNVPNMTIGVQASIPGTGFGE